MWREREDRYGMQNEKANPMIRRDGFSTESCRRRASRGRDMAFAVVTAAIVVFVLLVVDVDGGGEVGSVSKGTSNTRAGLFDGNSN